VNEGSSSRWSPQGWRDRPAAQQPNWPDADALQSALTSLAALPPLVTSWEVNALRERLALAETGQAFVLQGGDCAESFAGCRPDFITGQLKVLLQMSLVLTHGLRRRVVRVGRLAGQYAKPRSSDAETRDGTTLPSYRGDNVNGADFTAAARAPDPRRLVEGHLRSAVTMNFTRALVEGGFADLHHPEYWDLAWARRSPVAESYQERVRAIGESLRFMETIAGGGCSELSRVEFFISHEALLLDYEAAQTRTVPRSPGWYNLSTHLPWIGMRTADPGGAHVEYCRGIRNPIGIKLGPKMTPEWLLDLATRLNPHDEAGRLVLIHRMGAGRVAEHLPPLLEAFRRAGKRALWLCDPMHGNTISTAGGIKTRRFGDIRAEIEQSMEVHRAIGIPLGGLHLELTGDDVTECLGGSGELVEADLARAYRSPVDPRLNYEQALELALEVAALGGRL
jgi:3-deoxy-D-arabinoheptulosonate-7-phosphate synthase (EC 2.5.1.54)